MFSQPLVNDSSSGAPSRTQAARQSDNDGFVQAQQQIQQQETFEFDSSEVGCMYNFNFEEFDGMPMPQQPV